MHRRGLRTSISLLGSVILLLTVHGAFPSPIRAQEDVTEPDSAFLIEPSHAGPFFVGITPWEVKNIVGHRPLTLVDLFGEANFLPAVELSLDGNADEVSIVGYLGMLICDRFREWYFPMLVIRDRRFRTVDGIGVGSTLAEARDLGWVTSKGQPEKRALDPEVEYFGRVRFLFEGHEGECEGCPPPIESDRISGIILSESYSSLHDPRCSELMKRYR